VALGTPSGYLQIGEYLFDDVVDINSVSATYGRTNLAEQPSPSTFSCSYSLIQSNPTPPNIAIGDPVLWAVYDPTATGNLSYIFFGYISDLNQNVTNWRNGNGLIEYSITAVGPLSWLARDTLANNVSFSKQYEGNRIVSAGTYSAWADFDIETPGDYEVAADNNKGGETVLQVAQMAAQSGMGLLYEDLDVIKYETYATRTNRSDSYGLDETQVLATNLGTTQSVTTIANSVKLSYGAKGASTGTTYSDTESIDTFGKLSATRSTELHNSSDANSQAQILLASRAYPRPRLNTVQINLANTAIDNSLMSDLIATRTGQRVTIAVPRLIGTSFNGFIEGYTWTIGRNQEILTLTLSDYSENIPYTMWYNVGASIPWSTYLTNTTTWSDVI
jgi:hypothetical protein